MARPYSIDLRERVVSAVTSGETCRSVAARFGVAVSSVVKWSQRHRATWRMPGGTSDISSEHSKKMNAQIISEMPDMLPTKRERFYYMS